MVMIFRALCTFMQTASVLLSLMYPYRERLRFSPFVSVFISALYIFFSMTPYYMIDFNAHMLGQSRIVYSCIFILGMGLVISFLIRIRLSIAVFSVFLMRNLTDSLEMAAHFLYFFFIPRSVSSELCISLFYLAFQLVLTPLLILFISKYVKNQLNFTYNRFWSLLWTVPFIYYMFFRIFGKTDFYRRVENWPLQALILPVLWFFGTIISNYVIMNMISEAAQSAALREKLSYSDLLIKSQLKEYERVKENIAQSRKLRHDMKHHLVVLDGYLENGNVRSARKYLADLTRTIDAYSQKAYCSNAAVNSILNYFTENALAARTMLSMSVSLKETLPMAEADLCTIIGNLLENALEACERSGLEEPFISLRTGYAGNDMIVLTIQNSYTGEIRVRDGKFLSSKRNEAGVGTDSVRHMVKKYNGICNFSYENNIFNVSVLLNPGMQEN